jgi:hypothetical protein
MSSAPALDFYLVLAGPASAAASSRGSTRPRSVDAVYLFDAYQLREEQAARGVKQGVASSVLKGQWTAGEIYPERSARLAFTRAQAELLDVLRAS